MRILALLLLLSINVHAQDTQAYPRFSYAEMTNLASSSRLSHRIFYKPSKGQYTKWFDAVKKGDLSLIQQMVTQGQDIEVKDTASLGQTALLWSTFLGYLDITKYLVEKHNANLFATDRADVQHAFKSAILGGDLPTITYIYGLLKGQIDINAQDVGDGETALMVAVDNDRVDAVHFLIKQGADVHIISHQRNQNAYTYACRRNNTNMMTILQKAGAINHKTGKASCN